MYAFTATVGLYSEIVIQEQRKNDLTSRFPGLSNIVCYNLESMNSILEQISHMLMEISMSRFGFPFWLATYWADTSGSRSSAANITVRPQRSHCNSTSIKRTRIRGLGQCLKISDLIHPREISPPYTWHSRSHHAQGYGQTTTAKQLQRNKIYLLQLRFTGHPMVFYPWHDSIHPSSSCF